MPDSGTPPFVVLLASVLKPVDDTRMREKFAETLMERAGTRVFIAGRGTTGTAVGRANITTFPIFNGNRISLGRLAAQWRYGQLLRQLHPNLVIVHAPELLPLTLLWQALGRRRRFMYDIRENYALNVSTQHVYQGLTRRWLAAGLRWVETLAAKRAAGVVLAEASYAAELPFLRLLPAGRIVVLENKYQPAPNEKLPSQSTPLPQLTEPLRLLYSGTISVLNGVWEAIALAEQLHNAWPGGVRLTIIGFCQQPELLEQLTQKAALHSDWLILIGGGQMVPHASIVAQISRSHVGLLPYRPHPSTERCRPTKLFEYLAHGLPVLSSSNNLWQEVLDASGAGFSIDFRQPIDGPTLVARLSAYPFYPNGIPQDVRWAAEGKKLWHLLDSAI